MSPIRLTARHCDDLGNLADVPLLLVAAVIMLAVFIIWLLVTGAIQSHAWSIYESHGCHEVGTSSRCIPFQFAYEDATSFSTISAILCGVVPGLFGLVLGVPLVAGEIEQRTNRLAWTQTITRTRWLIAKIALCSSVVVVVVGALMPLYWWWANATQRSSRIQPPNFDITGFVEVFYALFALMLGVALGAVIRRTGWAFAAAIPLFLLGRYGIRNNLRAHLVAPVSLVSKNFASVNNVNWYLNAGFVPVGRTSPAPGSNWRSYDLLMERCQDVITNNTSTQVRSAAGCAQAHRLRYVLQFQPPSHFWSLQLAESAIFLVISLALLGVSVAAVRHWRT